MAKRGAAVLEMPERAYAPADRLGARMRRDPVRDFADEYDEQPERKARPASRPTVKLKVGSRLPLPTSIVGMVATGLAMVLLLGGVFWLLAVTRLFLLQDARFRVAGPAAIEIEGNHHLRRGQVLGLFSDDLQRNIFSVSLEQRQAELEAMPWVRRATVMRLLPGRLRVAIVERVPVAFVRQGSSVGLVDADGVLLDMPMGARTEQYAFPLVTGIMVTDPLSVRLARMRLFAQFTADLDAGGAKNTQRLSEIDLSNPEDVRALVEENGTTILVHFGEENFRERFDRMQALLPKWRAQYPNLASADMRYEQEIPLAMAKPAQAALLPKALPVPVPRTMVEKKPAVPTKEIAAARLLVKTPAASPTKPSNPSTHSFVPAPVVKPWQPISTDAAPVKPSVSAAARSVFVATPPALSAPKPITVTLVNAPVKALLLPTPKPLVTHPVKSGAIVSRKQSGGKLSAAKPILPSDPNSPPQAVPQ